MLAKDVQERSIKSPETLQPNQPCQRESIDSPTTLGSSKRSRKKTKKVPPELRNKRRPLDVRVKVCKDLVKAYDKEYAQRNSNKESTQVFEFSTKIISKSLNVFLYFTGALLN